MSQKKQCMLTIITALFKDAGRSVMKSIARCDHGHYGVGKGKSLPAGRVLGSLSMRKLI